LALADLAREAVVAAITSIARATSKTSPAGAAIALRAALDQATMLTPDEQHVLGEWLERIATRTCP
jgi:hypothetical protein